jgi:hypothetical protein
MKWTQGKDEKKYNSSPRANEKEEDKRSKETAIPSIIAISADFHLMPLGRPDIGPSL